MTVTRTTRRFMVPMQLSDLDTSEVLSDCVTQRFEGWLKRLNAHRDLGGAKIRQTLLHCRPSEFLGAVPLESANIEDMVFCPLEASGQRSRVGPFQPGQIDLEGTGWFGGRLALARSLPGVEAET
jgi:hypothetical protein